ncbi:MAG: hypothetical protein K2R93_09075 [Gemmatimonadaceae bacterium]|nr:hypothetical protein [Gemmatimonadaceae bacterium]
MNKLLLILHLLGLALGLAVPFANLILARVIAAAAPAERPPLGRAAFAMGRLGDIGLPLLWVTGLTMVFTKHGGFAPLPGTFHAKLAAVLLLTLSVGVIHMHRRKAMQGDAAAIARIQLLGRFNLLCALTAVVLAVITFEP